MLLAVKYAHIVCITLSGALFVWRGTRLIALGRSPAGWERVLPHIIDTLLLTTALGLVFMLRLNPLEHGWLAAKLVAVIGYIGFGFITLRFARSRSQQITAFSCATVTFAYIVLVAITREPWLPTALL